MKNTKIFLGALIIILASTFQLFPQVIDPFAPIYSINAQGDIYLIGNMNLTCPAGNCPTGINNNFSMVNVDIDSDASTFNSSSADLVLPPGSSVLWAGLYWGGSGNGSANQNKILFKAPGQSSYTELTGALTTSSYGFSAFKNVTALVQSAGSGTYTGANIQLATGSNRFGGWSLVVVFTDPNLPFRNLTVNDGFALVSSSNPNVNITPSGFTTPLSGPVNASIGVVAFDGDNGVAGGVYKGDRFKLNSTFLFDALNPTDDFFNSSITRLGVAQTNRNPNYVNTLGLDIDVVDATGILPNGATSATINLTTGGESYIPIVVTSVIELFAPQILVNKTSVDLNGGELRVDDIIEYTLVLTNVGKDIASNVTFKDTIPAFTSYVPGSLVISSGANAGAKTDATGDDQGFFQSNVVNFNLGTGATATAGGELAINASTTIKFKVKVNSVLDDSTEIKNFGTANYIGKTLGVSGGVYNSPSNVVKDYVRSYADLSLTKTANTTTPLLGDNITFTIIITNSGPDQATGVKVKDLLPPEVTFVTAFPSKGFYNNVTGIWNIGNMTVGEVDTLKIVANLISNSPFANVAEVFSSNQKDPDSTPNNNNGAEDDRGSVTIVPLQLADLSISKSVTPHSPNVGDQVTYTIKVKNGGPATATNIVIYDSFPSQITYNSHVASSGTYNPMTGIWTIASLANGATDSLKIVGTLNISGQVTNVVKITNSDQDDPDYNDRTDSVKIPLQTSDLKVKKVVDNPAPVQGSIITYTVIVTNNGPNTGTGIIAIDQLPAGITFLSVTTNKGSYNNVTGEWNVGPLPVGDTAKLFLNAVVNTTSPKWNLVKIVSRHEQDPDFSNDKDSCLVTPLPAPKPNLLIQKYDNKGIMPDSGETNTYFIKYKNTGNGPLLNVTIIDTLPNGTSYLSCTGGNSCGETFFSSNVVQWQINNLAPGDSGIVTVTVSVDSKLSEYLNKAYLFGKDVNDSNYSAYSEDLNIADTSSSGGVGGIESNGDMAELLLNRLIKIQNGWTTKMLAKTKSIMNINYALNEFIPSFGPYNSIPIETTPFDILGISNATSSYAVDYKMNTAKGPRRVASIFATTTNPPNIYNHTKIVCDRLSEFEILSVELIQLDGFEFYLAKLRNENLSQTDYSISFSAFERNFGFEIQSRWTYDEYVSPFDTKNIYNFQVWSSTKEGTLFLVKEVLNKLKIKGSLYKQNMVLTLPDYVVSKAIYTHNGRINLKIIKLVSGSLQVNARINYRINQGESMLVMNKQFNLTKPVEEFVINTGIIADAKINFASSSNFMDEVYVSGGAFTYFAGNGTIVNNFETKGFSQNNCSNDNLNSENIAGGVQISGDLKDFVTVLRSVKANGSAYNFGTKSYIQFNAVGSGKISVFIEMSGTKNYNYHTKTITLSNTNTNYIIPLEEFKERFGGDRKLDAAKIEKIGFILEKSNNPTLQKFNISFSNISLTYNLKDPDQVETPKSYELSQNYPNPFNPSTKINFTLVNTEKVTLKIYDILGREVQTLINNEMLSAGNHTITFNANNLSTGVYLYKLETENFTSVKKMVLIK